MKTLRVFLNLLPESLKPLLIFNLSPQLFLFFLLLFIGRQAWTLCTGSPLGIRNAMWKLNSKTLIYGSIWFQVWLCFHQYNVLPTVLEFIKVIKVYEKFEKLDHPFPPFTSAMGVCFERIRFVVHTENFLFSNKVKS